MTKQKQKRKRQGKRAPAGGSKRVAAYQREFAEDLRFWIEANPQVAQRALDLVENALRAPFSGDGNPQPLKYSLARVWSRRLTEEHRIVYLVTKTRIDFLQARYHY